MMLISSLLQQLNHLPEFERERLLRAGIYEAAQARIHELRKEISECERHIREFERRYGVSFSEFEEKILPEAHAFAIHDDYNDWYYWEEILAEKKRLLEELERVEVVDAPGAK